MKITTTLLLVMFCSLLMAQEVVTDSEGFQTFTYEQEDTTYTMKQYFIVFLKKGENREQGQEEAAEIQKNHLNHIQWMSDQGYLDMAGPFGDDGEIRGILIMRVPNLARARELASMDPAVQAGRLIMEIHPWWAAVGSSLK